MPGTIRDSRPVQRAVPIVPIVLSARCALVGMEFMRSLRGCDADTVLACVGVATHPQYLRWVFNVAVDARDARRRELRFWKDEVMGLAVNRLPVADGLRRILGERAAWKRGDLEIAWTINAMTISRLVRARELTEANHGITRASLAAFLKRRLV